MSTLLALLSLPWPQLLELGLLAWLGSIGLMFPVFYVAMLALRAGSWIDACYDDDTHNPTLNIVQILLFVPLVFCGVVLAIAASYDWLINHTSAALLFFDRAREPMVTGRLERYKRSANNEYGWRTRFAAVICTKCLDWADPSGRHCR